MSNNVNGSNFSGIAWYYGDNDFIIQTFDFIARSDARMCLVVPDMHSHVTCSKSMGL